MVFDYYNRRIKVMDFTGPFEEISGTLEALAKAEELGKIIVYTPPEKRHGPETCGYMEEGIIKGYYTGKDCHIFSSYPVFSCYPQNSREISFHKEKEEQIVKNCLRKGKEAGKPPQKPVDSRRNGSWKKQKEKTPFPEEYTLRPAVQADASAMASIYCQGFQFYPTPLHMESYLLKTMYSNALYLLVEKQGKIVSLASAEMDPENGSAEITDCLTVPSERGKGLMKELIVALEKELSARNFLSAYTLCRASSYGINTAFASLGYAYTGRLVNNCRIGRGFEDMNIWCKMLK
ncbi:MAG: putative beta-lysine N-acetyltransferase [Methanosarcina sp.]|nr:putative beta-lysine N-acetyltransferase [Methanosarcina sp.]MDY9928043.1 putative beta-lysine N-acetyltransferase [Methanosarcina sp.]